MHAEKRREMGEEHACTRARAFTMDDPILPLNRSRKALLLPINRWIGDCICYLLSRLGHRHELHLDCRLKQSWTVFEVRELMLGSS